MTEFTQGIHGAAKRIYENNPIWIAWEEKTYGNLTTIIPTSRLISKASKFFRLN